MLELLVMLGYSLGFICTFWICFGGRWKLFVRLEYLVYIELLKDVKVSLVLMSQDLEWMLEILRSLEIVYD